MSYVVLAKKLLRQHEGIRSKPYLDTVGKVTIGIGRNLTDVGLRKEEIEFLFENDVAEAERIARKLVKNFEQISDNRKAVILSLAFNLGETRLAKFVNTLGAINMGEWERAATGLENSLWYYQVGNRAKELIELLRKG